MQDEKILITLSNSENKLLKSVLKQYDVDVVEVDTRSKLLNLTQKEKPLMILMNISAEDGIGGAAVGEAILKVSPNTSIIFVGKDTEKNLVESLSLGDDYIFSPIDSENADIVLRTSIVKARIHKTGRLKHKERFDSKSQEKQAIQKFVLQLSTARRMGEFANIIRSYLLEMLTFKVFVFSTIEKRTNLINSRIYCNDDLNADTMLKLKDKVIANINNSPDKKFNFEFVTHGHVAENTEEWEDCYNISWEMNAHEQIGYVDVFNNSPINISEPLKNLVSTMLTQASTFIGWMRELETDRMELLNTITDIMNEGVLWVDDKKTDVYVNKSAKLIFRECLNAPIQSVLHKDKLYDVLRRLNIFEDLFGLEAHKQKTITTTSTINDYLIEFNIYRIMQGDRKDYTGTLFVIRNKTEQRDEAQENFEILNALINEIKEPLKSIDNLSNLLYENLKSQSLSREFFRNIEVIKDSVNKTSEIVNYFVNTNRLKHDPLRKKPVNVEEIFDDVFSMYKSEADVRNLTLKKEVLPGAQSILADPEKIKLALKNLVLNSINYTPDGGEIILRSEPSEYAEISGKDKFTRRKKIGEFTKLPRYYVEISCSDTGLGIPEDHHLKVFERFAQTATPAITGKKGIGLGLTLAQNIIEYHGGVIWIDREYKDGTKVVFSIPVGFQLPKNLN